jgi:hypothetical protein
MPVTETALGMLDELGLRPMFRFLTDFFQVEKKSIYIENANN